MIDEETEDRYARAGEYKGPPSSEKKIGWFKICRKSCKNGDTREAMEVT